MPPTTSEPAATVSLHQGISTPVMESEPGHATTTTNWLAMMSMVSHDHWISIPDRKDTQEKREVSLAASQGQDPNTPPNPVPQSPGRNHAFSPEGLEQNVLMILPVWNLHVDGISLIGPLHHRRVLNFLQC